MGLYDLKEFLTFDDVADYLTDKGVYKFNLSDEKDSHRLKNFLFEFVINGKLTPIFYYTGTVYECLDNVKEIYDRLDEIHKIDKEKFSKYLFSSINFEKSKSFKGFFTVNNRMIKQFMKNNYITLADFRLFPNRENYAIESDICYTYQTNERLALLNICHVESDITIQPQFPKSQLDAIFNPNQTTDTTTLQTQLDQAHARIAELESQVKDLDARTENNLIRALLVVNEWAKSKNGKYLDFDKEYNKSHLQDLNTQLELLGHKNMGETAYKTLIELVKKAKSKGL